MDPHSSLQFGKCLLDQQHIIKDIVPSDNLPFSHPSFCQLDGLKETDKHIALSSVGIISDINSKLLVTKRNKELPTFPSGWVFPGGKLDKKEHFEDALIREVREETGITINKHNKNYRYQNKQCNIEPIFQYESLFPKNAVSPWSQVLVIYFLIVLPFDYNDIMLHFQTDEIDGYSWIHIDDLYQMFNNNEKRTVEGYLFNRDTSQFENNSLNENNFCDIPGKVNKYEYMPHGHRSAIKVIYENDKLYDKTKHNFIGR